MHFAGARAGNNDWRVARHIAGAAADLQPVNARQHQVEDQCIPATLFQHRHPQIAIGGMADVIAFIAQM
ncbi:hypothetical protein D3C75_1154650 [compost metagenome]